MHSCWGPAAPHAHQVLAGLAAALPFLIEGTLPQPWHCQLLGHPRALGFCSQHGQGAAESQAQLRNDQKTEAFHGKMKPHNKRAARWVPNATAWVSKFTKHQRQEVSLPSLVKELPLRVVLVSFSAAEGGGENQQPQNKPWTVCPGQGARLPRVTTVSTATTAPQPCSIHRAMSPQCPLFSSILGLVGTCNQVPTELIWAQGRAGCAVRLQPGPTASCYPGQNLDFFFPLPAWGQSWLLRGDRKTITTFQAGGKTVTKVGLERIKDSDIKAMPRGWVGSNPTCHSERGGLVDQVVIQRWSQKPEQTEGVTLRWPQLGGLSTQL